MENLEKLLDKLIACLEEEKELLINSLKDSKLSEKLMEIVDTKREILLKISQLSREDLEKHQEKLKEIKRLSDINLNLAVNNIQFIDEIFSAIFEEPQKYDQSGAVKQNQKGLFNKKI